MTFGQGQSPKDTPAVISPLNDVQKLRDAGFSQKQASELAKAMESRRQEGHGALKPEEMKSRLRLDERP